MWCLETLQAINEQSAQGKNAYEAYAACGIRTLSNTPKDNDNGKVSDAPIPIGNVRRDSRNVAS